MRTEIGIKGPLGFPYIANIMDPSSIFLGRRSFRRQTQYNIYGGESTWLYKILSWSVYALPPACNFLAFLDHSAFLREAFSSRIDYVQKDVSKGQNVVFSLKIVEQSLLIRNFNNFK